MKNVQIRSLFNLSEGKYKPEKAPYLDTFHAVFNWALDIMLLVFILFTVSLKTYFISAYLLL